MFIDTLFVNEFICLLVFKLWNYLYDLNHENRNVVFNIYLIYISKTYHYLVKSSPRWLELGEYVMEIILIETWCLEWVNAITSAPVFDVSPLISRYMGPSWGPSGADRTQVGPMLTPWTLLSGTFRRQCSSLCNYTMYRTNRVLWSLQTYCNFI